MTTQIIRPISVVKKQGTVLGVPDWSSDQTSWYKNVDEETLDTDDCTYVHHGSTNGILCGLSAPVHSGAISKVTVTAVCSSGNGEAKLWIGNADESYLSSAITVQESRKVVSADWEENPLTGLAWTWDDIDDICAGFQISGFWPSDTNCSQLYVTITHDPTAPSVTTLPGNDLHPTTFTGNGNITFTGGTVVLRRGFCYTTEDSDPTIADSKSYNDGSFQAGAYTKSVTGLTAGTTYNVRAFATNSIGTGYGETVQVTVASDGTVTWVNTPYSAFSSAEFRGGGVFGGKIYAVIGANVIAVTTAGAVSILGVLTTSTGRIFMAYNGIQVLIVDGTAYGHYITTASDTLSDISDADFPESNSCAFIDGYFVVTKTNTGRFYISALYDASSWDALDYATAEGSPDNLVHAFAANSNLWLFGDTTIEVYYNSGNEDFPFQRISGAIIEDGLAGSAAVCMIKDQFYFLSNKLEVLRTVGYQREKISTLHIDTEIQGYTTVSDAVMYEYRIDGHVFVVLTFPTEDKTWVYDISTDYWHEWQSYKTQGVATYGRHRGAIGFFFNNKWMVGDHTDGSIYELDMGTYTENGELIRRIRRAQTINKDRLNVIHHLLELDLEFGSSDGVGGAGVAPVLTLRWSDDGARTWSTNRTLNLGKAGDYKARARATRLGKSRNRIYEITMTEPVRFALLAAYADLEALRF